MEALLETHAIVCRKGPALLITRRHVCFFSAGGMIEQKYLCQAKQPARLQTILPVAVMPGSYADL